MTEHAPNQPAFPPVQLAIIRVKEAIGAIGKEKSGDGIPYKYRGVDDILNAAHHALIDNGLIIAPIQAVPTYDSYQAKGGGQQRWVSLVVDWLVMGPAGDVLLCDVPEINPTTGELVIVKRPPQTIGEAADSSDKATNKAHTAAYKILLTELFAIPFAAEDPDATRPPEPWGDSDEMARAENVVDRLKALPAELADRVRARITGDAKERGWEGARADWPTDLPASWLHAWESLVAAAEKRHAAQGEASGAESVPDDPTPPEPPPEPATGHTGAVSRGTVEPEPDRAGLPTTWDAIMALSPSQLAKTLVDNGWGTSGSKNTQRRRLASKLAIEIPPDAGTGER